MKDNNNDAKNFFKAIGMVVAGFAIVGVLLVAIAPASAWKDADAEIAAIAAELHRNNPELRDTTLEDILFEARLARLDYILESSDF